MLVDPAAAERLLRWLADPPDAPAPEEIADADWRPLLDAAQWHGVMPLLFRRIERARPAARVPEPLRSALRHAYHHSALRAAATLAEAGRVLSALAEAGLPAIPLKGLFLGQHVYGDPALRPMNDLDVLVPADRLGDAEVALVRLGYTPKDRDRTGTDHDAHHHGVPLVKAGARPVELHRALSEPRSPFDLPAADLWARARPARVAGAAVLALAREDLLLHLALHLAYGHRFGTRLLHLCDIAEIARDPGGVDYARFAAGANAAGAGGFAYAALAAARDMLRAPVPDETLAALRHGPGDARVVAAARTLLLAGDDDLPVAVERMSAAQPPADRARVALRGLLPTPSQMRRIYGLRDGSPAVFWYYLVRPFDLLRRRGATMLHLLRGSPRTDPALRRARSRREVEEWVAGAARSVGPGR